jgi:hypothetical protein
MAQIMEAKVNNPRGPAGLTPRLVHRNRMDVEHYAAYGLDW